MAGKRPNRSKLRVVTLVDGIGLGGGGERLAREIVVRLGSDRFEPILCVSRWSRERESDPAVAKALARLDESGVEFLGLTRRGSADLAGWRPLLSLLRRERIDVLHSHKFGSNVWAAVLGSVARTPAIVAHEHTWSFEGQRLRRILDRRLIAARSDAFVTVSREDRRRMIEIEGIDPGKLVFIPNGIPEARRSGGGDLRAELGSAPGDPIVGTVCSLRPQKALEVLVEAAVPLSARFPGLRVVIVGDGPERPALERRIGELGLGDVIRLLGHRNDVPDLLTSFNVAVCSSDFEGTPLSILEYMQAALPVVSTRVGGVPDVIEDGVHGLLVERRDPQALAAAVAELLDDPQRAATIAARAHERQTDEFDIRVTVRAIERLYEGLAAGIPARELHPTG